MPLFKFKAKDKKDKTIEDVVQAANKKEVAALLKSENYKVLTIKSLEGKYKGIFLGGDFGFGQGSVMSLSRYNASGGVALARCNRHY